MWFNNSKYCWHFLEQDLWPMVFSEQIKTTVKDAASKLTGHHRRDFMATAISPNHRWYSEFFKNVFAANQASDQAVKSLRLSIDSQAKVKIGLLSRGGKARTLEPKVALDHDMRWEALLVPFGILNTQTD